MLGIVVNRHSKRSRSHPAEVDHLRTLVDGDGRVACTDSAGEVKEALGEMRAVGMDTLALVGGDGTVGFTLTLLREVYGDAPLPSVSLLHGGTMNTVAKAVGAPAGPPLLVLRRLLEARRVGRGLSCRRVATIDVAGRLGFLFGTGVGRTFLEEYYRRGDPYPDMRTAVRTLGAIAGSVAVRGRTARRLVTPERYVLEVDGRREPARSYVAIMAGTVSQVGLGFAPFYRSGPNARGFHLLALHGTPLCVLRRLPRAYRGAPLGEDCALDLSATEVRIDAAGKLVPHFVDGDLYEAKSPLALRLGPSLTLVWARPS